MHSRLLLRSGALLAGVVLAASPAFAQIQPDTPVSPPTSAPGSGAMPREIQQSLMSAMNATDQAIQALSSASLEPVGTRHATVLDALAMAHASPAVVDCVTRFHAAENAALTDKIRQLFAKLKAALKTQLAATLAEVMKQQGQIKKQPQQGSVRANPGSSSREPAQGSQGANPGSSLDVVQGPQDANPGSSQQLVNDVAAAFNAMEVALDTAQDKLLAGLR